MAFSDLIAVLVSIETPSRFCIDSAKQPRLLAQQLCRLSDPILQHHHAGGPTRPCPTGWSGTSPGAPARGEFARLLSPCPEGCLFQSHPLVLWRLPLSGGLRVRQTAKQVNREGGRLCPRVWPAENRAAGRDDCGERLLRESKEQPGGPAREPTAGSTDSQPQFQRVPGGDAGHLPHD